MVLATGNVEHNLRTIDKVAESHQNANIRITSGAQGESVVIKPVEMRKGWVAGFVGLFGFNVSQSDASGSSQQFISAFKGNYGDAVGEAVMKACGIKAGKTLSGRQVTRAMKKADELVVEQKD